MNADRIIALEHLEQSLNNAEAFVAALQTALDHAPDNYGALENLKFHHFTAERLAKRLRGEFHGVEVAA